MKFTLTFFNVLFVPLFYFLSNIIRHLVDADSG